MYMYFISGITHNGETRPWSQLDPWVITNVFMIRNVGETSNEFKRVSIYPDVELTIRRFQHDISFIGIIFHDLGMYWDLEDPMTGVVGEYSTNLRTSTLSLGRQVVMAP